MDDDDDVLGPTEPILSEHTTRRLSDALIAVAGDGALAAEIVRLLELNDVRTIRTTLETGVRSAVSLTIIADNNADPDRVIAANRLQLRERGPFIVAQLHAGEMMTVGPLVVPGETACFECLQLRRATLSEFGPDTVRLLAPMMGTVALPHITALTAALTVQQSMRWIGSLDPRVPGRVVVSRPFAVDVTEHLVLRVPGCPSCRPDPPVQSRSRVANRAVAAVGTVS